MCSTKYVVLFLITSFLGHVECCYFPATLRNGTWESNDMGEVTFNSTHFTITDMASFGGMTFECISKTGNRYYTESAPFLYLGSNLHKASMCFELTKMSDYKYSYYLLSNVLENTDVNRIILGAATYSFTSAETCALSTRDPTQARLFVRSGYANMTASTCGNPISKIYEYNITSSASFTCNETSLNICDDRTQFVFNYTLCSDVMAYSAGGRLFCMWDYEDNNTNTLYTLLYNQDETTDESTTYRYTCLVSTTVGDNITYISTYPRACLANQTANESATPTALSAYMFANYSCPDEIVTAAPLQQSEEPEVLSAGAVTAIILAMILLVLAGVVVGALYYIKVYKKKKVSPDGEKGKVDETGDVIPAKSPPIDTNIKDDEKSGRVSPFSPYPTVSELAVYRFGPEPATVEIDDDDGGMTLEATTPGFTEGRRTKYDIKDNESMASLPVYSEVGDPTPDPTRLSEVQTVMSEITITENVTEPMPFTMTRATMNIPEENTVSPMESPRELA